jgi:hypothetical protein
MTQANNKNSDILKNIIFTDSDGLADNTLPAFVIIEVGRESILDGNLALTLDKLHVLTDSVEKVRLYQEKVFFTVAGYDTDPRELIEIPEVRAFFSKLVKEWPHWLWFLNRESGCLTLLFSLLCEVKVVRTRKNYQMGDFIQYEIADTTHMLDILRVMAERSEVLFTIYDIPKEEAIQSYRSARSVLTNQ